MKINPELWIKPPLFWPSIEPMIRKVNNESDTAALTKRTKVNGLSVKSPIVSRLTANK